MNEQSIDVLSFGTVYLDMDFLNFPFVDGIFAHRETVGSAYALEVGGSAFNFAKICANFELQVMFVGKIGQDPTGITLKEISKQSSVHANFIESKDVQTNLAVHYVHQDGTSIMTSAGSANQNLSPEDLKQVIRESLPFTKYLYLGGGFKLLKLLSFYPEIIEVAQEHKVKVVLDHGRVTNLVTTADKNIIKSIIQHIDIYLPSRDEFLDLWGYETLEQGLEDVGKKIKGKIIIKDSSNGSLSWDDNQLITVPPVPVTPINTIGAGDSFNAGYIKGDSLGLATVVQKMQYASSSAAIKISTTHLPTSTEVDTKCQEFYPNKS